MAQSFSSLVKFRIEDKLHIVSTVQAMEEGVEVAVVVEVVAVVDTVEVVEEAMEVDVVQLHQTTAAVAHPLDALIALALDPTLHVSIVQGR